MDYFLTTNRVYASLRYDYARNYANVNYKKIDRIQENVNYKKIGQIQENEWFRKNEKNMSYLRKIGITLERKDRALTDIMLFRSVDK